MKRQQLCLFSFAASEHNTQAEHRISNDGQQFIYMILRLYLENSMKAKVA